MRGVHIFEKPCCREIRVMRGRAMRGLPVPTLFHFLKSSCFKSKCGCIMNSISEMIFSSRLLNFKVAYLSQI